MQIIIFDRLSLDVRGIDRQLLPFEFGVRIPFPISLNKTIQEMTGNDVQKTNDQGELLYKDNVQVDEFGIETFDEVTTAQKVLSYEPVTNTYKVQTGETTEPQVNEFGETVDVVVPIYEDITTTSEVPLEVEDLLPVMISEVVNKTYKLEENMSIFTYDEIVGAKKQAINNNSLTTLFFYDEDFLGNDVVLTDCSVGDGLVILHPHGELVIPTMTIPSTTDIIELYQESQNAGLKFYVNDVEVVKDRVKLPSPTDQITIKVTNPTAKNLELYALGGMC